MINLTGERSWELQELEIRNPILQSARAVRGHLLIDDIISAVLLATLWDLNKSYGTTYSKTADGSSQLFKHRGLNSSGY